MSLERESLTCLAKTKLKGNGEVSWCGVNGSNTGIEERERAREAVAILLNDVWHSAVIDFGCVKSRNLWLKFVQWWGAAPIKELVKKGRGSGITCTELWIE